VHLPEIVDTGDIGDVRRERDPPWTNGTDATKAPRDDRSQSVSTDDHTRAICSEIPAHRFPSHDARYRAGVIQNLFNLHTLANLRARGFSRGA